MDRIRDIQVLLAKTVDKSQRDKLGTELAGLSFVVSNCQRERLENKPPSPTLKDIIAWLQSFVVADEKAGF